MASQISCVLADGRVVRFSLLQRHPSPYVYLRFQAEPGKRAVVSSNHTTRKAAIEAAPQVIADYLQPVGHVTLVTWEEARQQLEAAFKAQNLRPPTIKDYLSTYDMIRRFCASSISPQDVSDQTAKRFKEARSNEVHKRANGSEHRLSAWTISGVLNKLSCLWQKWLLETLKLVQTNPWLEIEKPKCDKESKRILTPDEEAVFFNWIEERFGSFTLPVLFFKVKSSIGCRIAELSSLETSSLRDGCVVFVAGSAKSRRERVCPLPPELYASVKAIAGNRYVWEGFPAGLREWYLNKGSYWKGAATQVQDTFLPERLPPVLYDVMDKFREANPSMRYWRPHNLRGTAMSRTKQIGATYDEASDMFGCSIETMKKHYVEYDSAATSKVRFGEAQKLQAKELSEAKARIAAERQRLEEQLRQLEEASQKLQGQA